MLSTKNGLRKFFWPLWFFWFFKKKSFMSSSWTIFGLGQKFRCLGPVTFCHFSLLPSFLPPLSFQIFTATEFYIFILSFMHKVATNTAFWPRCSVCCNLWNSASEFRLFSFYILSFGCTNCHKTGPGMSMEPRRRKGKYLVTRCDQVTLERVHFLSSAKRIKVLGRYDIWCEVIYCLLRRHYKAMRLKFWNNLTLRICNFVDALHRVLASFLVKLYFPWFSRFNDWETDIYPAKMIGTEKLMIFSNHQLIFDKFKIWRTFLSSNINAGV